MLAGSLGALGSFGTKWFSIPLAAGPALLDEEELEELELLDDEEETLLDSIPLLDSLSVVGAVGLGAGAAGVAGAS